MNLDLARENKAKAKFEIKLSEGGTELDFLKKAGSHPYLDPLFPPHVILFSKLCNSVRSLEANSPTIPSY